MSPGSSPDEPGRGAPPPGSPDDTAETVERKAVRLRRRRRPPGLFAHLAQVGVLGWVFVLPVVALAWAGHLVGLALGERVWPAVAGLLAGLALGAYLTWRNLREGLAHAEDEAPGGPEEGDHDVPRDGSRP